MAYVSGTTNLGTLDCSGNLTVGGTITSTGAINASGVVTATGFTIGGAAILEAELEVADGVTTGTWLPSKMMTVASNGAATANLSFVLKDTSGNTIFTLDDAGHIDFGAGTIEINSTAVTATAAELNYCDVTTLGTVQASKALTADSGADITLSAEMVFKDISGNTIFSLDPSGNLNIATGKLEINAVAVTATAAELNYVDVATLGTVEASKALTADSSADLTCSDQMAFKDASGNTIFSMDLSGNAVFEYGKFKFKDVSGNVHWLLDVSGNYGVWA